MRTKRFLSVKSDPKSSLKTIKFITPKQLKDIIKKMYEAGDYRSILIVELQYGYGLRRGEVLGLTEEDIVSRKEYGQVNYYIILRNRLSDRDDQFCKNLPHPTSTEVYSTTRYTENQEEIPITKETYCHIIEYIRLSRDIQTQGKDKVLIINKLSKADSIEGKQNHYIFVGKNGKPYTGQSWNNKLKHYFFLVGIMPDIGKKYNNCSHRLRHGFAMFHAHYSDHPLNQLQLMKMMRHRSISSTQIYYNILPEDEIKMRNEMNSQLTKFFNINEIQDK